MQNKDETEISCHDLLACIRAKADPEARSGAYAQLCEMYRPLIGAYVKRFSLSPFAEESELEQEAHIALYRAALTYEENRHTTFGLYAGICIRNRLISCLRREEAAHGMRDAHSAGEDGKTARQRSALSYPVSNGGDSDPGETLAERDMFREAFDRFLASLTVFERRVFTPYIRGASYKEIAARLSVSEKSVDNAVYRIRVKLKRQLQ